VERSGDACTGNSQILSIQNGQREKGEHLSAGDTMIEAIPEARSLFRLTGALTVPSAKESKHDW